MNTSLGLKKARRLDAMVRFRCSADLVQRLELIALKHRRELPDLMRLLLSDFADAEENRLKLRKH